MITKEEITLKNLMRLTSGRGIAADFQGHWLVNIYAPSGTTRRQEREFLQSRTQYLLQSAPSSMILGSDFNCGLAKTDCTVSSTTAELLTAMHAELT